MTKSSDHFWVEIAKSQLLDRKIVEVRYLTDDEMDGLGWSQKCVVMVLDDGNIIFPSRDDEGNDAGSLFTTNEEHPTLPIIR
jgi:hypothetical protein